MVDAGLPAVYDIRRLEWRQAVEPEAGGLDLAVAELPGLNDLILTAADDLPAVLVDDGVLDGNQRYVGVEEPPEELRGLGHLGPPDIVPAAVGPVQPSDAAICEEGARGMEDRQIPAVVQMVQDIALDMRTRALRRQEIAGDGIMAGLDEGVADGAGKFAADECFHIAPPSTGEKGFPLDTDGIGAVSLSGSATGPNSEKASRDISS